MQSADYVPGVSGWKISKAIIELNGGPCGPVRLGDLDAVYDHATYIAAGIGLGVSEFDNARAKGPDAVLRYLSEEISSSKLATDLRRSIDDGNSDLAAALAEAGRMKLEKVASKDRERAMEEVVRDVLRKEIRPGGLLYRR
ncbi:hypothetical protein [Pseudomonas sp. BJa3]|uniref:hypothetical protein n=1 Tax=Pseudomonas sp. BJa3 TaxID=2986525 RepID=UPI002265D947|nr:hypothetical protein [Pseudomonas sp. BJa3]MCX5511331.1 hypothetical protein [Pseudomonas sp. BJa3]